MRRNQDALLSISFVTCKAKFDLGAATRPAGISSAGLIALSIHVNDADQSRDRD